MTDIEDELISILSKEISACINVEILRDLMKMTIEERTNKIRSILDKIQETAQE